MLALVLRGYPTLSSPWELSREGVTPQGHQLATVHCSARLALQVVWGRGERSKPGRLLTHSWFPAVPLAQKALMDTADLAGAFQKGDTAWESERITQDHSDLGFVHAIQRASECFPP